MTGLVVVCRSCRRVIPPADLELQRDVAVALNGQAVDLACECGALIRTLAICEEGAINPGEDA